MDRIEQSLPWLDRSTWHHEGNVTSGGSQMGMCGNEDELENSGISVSYGMAMQKGKPGDANVRFPMVCGLAEPILHPYRGVG